MTAVYLPSFLSPTDTASTKAPTAAPISTKPKAVRGNGGAIDSIREKIDVLGEVLAGVEGRRFDWGMVEGESKAKRLAALGIELVTANGARKKSHVLKKGVKPIGKRYFGAPIQRSADLYILGVQTKPSK